MSSKEKRILKIVFLGDCNVGKSSIISTCVSDENGSMLDAWKDDQSRFILYPVLLRSETSLSTYDTILVDTYGGETKKDALKATISSAQSIILVYDLADPNSYQRLMENWLPLINEFNESCPIIIVGNKQDLAKQDEELYDRTKIKKIIVPILREFPQVELGIECSAREGKNIVEALYCAQCVYLFPLGPLYIQSQKDLTEKYKKTLTTIFRILDKDGDGKLSDYELGSLQEFVFTAHLAPDDIRGIKDIIKEELKDISNERGVNLEGFFLVNRKMIEMLKIKNCWMIIKKFGFNENLELSHDTLDDSFAE